MNKEEQIKELMKLVERLSEREQKGFFQLIQNIDLVDTMTEESMSQEQIKECINKATEEKDFTLFATIYYQKQKQELKKNIRKI